MNSSLRFYRIVGDSGSVSEPVVGADSSAINTESATITGPISYRIQDKYPISLQVLVVNHLRNESDRFKKLSSNDNIMDAVPMSRRDERSTRIPQGVRYSLTLHDRNKQRIIGYDNAHAIREKRGRFMVKTMTWDHRHIHGRVAPYKYTNAEKLMVDFWNDVDRVLSEMNR